jgi:hypothetical protein
MIEQSNALYLEELKSQIPPEVYPELASIWQKVISN